MKEADTDWLIYHQLTENAPVSTDALASRCGLAIPEIEASLVRLERSCLIERNGKSVRMLTFGEALVRNQLKYEEDLPFMVENGVIKAKKQDPCQEKK